MKYPLLFSLLCWLSALTVDAQDPVFKSAGFDFAEVSMNGGLSLTSTAQSSLQGQAGETKIFIAYEFGEAIFNKFQSVSGEVGLLFEQEYSIRLVHMNLNLTEAHLSTKFAAAVDGNDVEGRFFGFEAFFDIPVFFDGFHISPSIGHYQNEYKHTIQNESFKKSSFTLGASIGFRETELFGVKGLYYRFAIPMRCAINPINETKLGETTIKSNAFDNNIWLFVGFEF